MRACKLQKQQSPTLYGISNSIQRKVWTKPNLDPFVRICCKVCYIDPNNSHHHRLVVRMVGDLIMGITSVVFLLSSLCRNVLHILKIMVAKTLPSLQSYTTSSSILQPWKFFSTWSTHIQLQCKMLSLREIEPSRICNRRNYFVCSEKYLKLTVLYGF